MTRVIQKITEVLPVKPPSFHPKKRRWFDTRKTCLSCGYLETLSRYDFAETEEKNLSWTENRDIVSDSIRKEILKTEAQRWAAKDFRCYRGIWDATFGKDINERTLRGLEEATRKRTCRFFFPWSVGDSPKIHRDLHRARTAWRRTFWATIIGAIIGGGLALAGSILVSLYFPR